MQIKSKICLTDREGMGAKKEADKHLRQIPPGRRDRHIARKLHEREI